MKKRLLFAWILLLMLLLPFRNGYSDYADIPEAERAVVDTSSVQSPAIAGKADYTAALRNIRVTDADPRPTEMQSRPILHYRDENMTVSITRVNLRKDVNGKRRRIVYFVAELKLSDPSLLKTGLSGGKFHGTHQTVAGMAADYNAIAAITGDYYDSQAQVGPACRNGAWWRDKPSSVNDLCILTQEGELRTYLAKTYDIEQIKAENPREVWCFGPSLITPEGTVPVIFNTTLNQNGEEPRSAIGSDRPGHYFLLVADGRRPEYSSGLCFTDLSQIFIDLGCTVAYNFDGGATAAMASAEGYISDPGVQRKSSDIVYVAYP